MKAKDKRALIASLQQDLQKVASPAVKEWFEAYLKGAVRYRGVKTPEVSKVLRAWRTEESLDALTERLQFELACDLIRETYAEDKFAGILYIQKYLVGELPVHLMLTEFEDLFAQGAFNDWSTTDWFVVRVLVPIMSAHGPKAHQRITGWYRSDSLWQRRSSMVALRACVREPRLTPLIERQMKRLLPSAERFIQTAIGWVLADLARHLPKAAQSLVEGHLPLLSLEVMRRHTKGLPRHKELIAKRKSLE